MRHVENIKFSLQEKEYRRQKTKIANKYCRHLKALERVKITDFDSDTIEEYIACTQCGYIMTKEDLEKRERLLIKFKNLK